MRKQRQNQCIIGDAILPQTGKKLTKKCGSEFGALLWRHLMLQRKPQYMCTTTIPQVHNSPRDLRKFTSHMTFGAHKLVHSEPFWTPDANFHNCCQLCIAKYGEKKIYIGAHLRSLF